MLEISLKILEKSEVTTLSRDTKEYCNDIFSTRAGTQVED